MKTLRALCAEMGISRRVIQGYEKAGLVKATAKNKYGYLLYDRKEEERIRKIRFLQKTGFRLKEIRELMDAPPERVKPALEEKRILLLRDIREKEALVEHLEKYIIELEGK